MSFHVISTSLRSRFLASKEYGKLLDLHFKALDKHFFG